MNSQERIRIGEIWINTAEVYGKEIKDAGLRIMLDAVSDLPFEAVLSALRDWPRVSKQQRHPFPAEVREMAGGGVSADAEATAAATRVQQAITRFGWPNGKEAQLFIGSLGWTVVQRLGGWLRVCEMVGVDYDKSAFFAHAKSIAKSEAEYSRAGRHDEPPQLPPPAGPGKSGLESAGSIVERLLGGPGDR